MRFLLGSPLLLEEFGNVDFLVYGGYQPPPSDCMVVRGNAERLELFKNGSLIGLRESNENPIESFVFEPVKGLKVFLSNQKDFENLEIFRFAFYMNVTMVVSFMNKSMSEEDIMSLIWPTVQDNYFLLFLITPFKKSFLYSVLAPTGFTEDHKGILGILEPFIYNELKISFLHRLRRNDPISKKMRSPSYVEFLLKHFS